VSGVQADRAKQAAAYAAVSGNITKTTPQQLYHAGLAANDPGSCEIAEMTPERPNGLGLPVLTSRTSAVTLLVGGCRKFCGATSRNPK
jgi:hypothetical protein